MQTIFSVHALTCFNAHVTQVGSLTMLGLEGDGMELSEEEQMEFIQKAARKSTLINLILFAGIVATLRIGESFNLHVSTS